MPKEETPEVAPFQLGDLADLARQVSPELAAEVNREIGAPVEGATGPAEGEPIEGASGPEGATGAVETEGATGPASNEEELAELQRQSEEAAAQRAGATGPTGAESGAGATGPTGAVERDADLKLEEKNAAHLHPRTRKLIEDRNVKIIGERNRADSLAKEKADLQEKLTAAEAAAKSTVVPKEVTDELAKLRDRVRELDVAHDPEIVDKFDKPVTANNDRIIALLTEWGLGKTPEGKDVPEHVAALKKQGISLTTIAPYIKKLDEAGQFDAAEQLREILRDNLRLGREKEREISSWRTSYAERKSKSDEVAQQNQQQLMTQVQTHAKTFVQSDIASLTKDFPFLARPSEALPTDTPAVAKAKSDAIAAYDSAAKTVSEIVTSLDPSKAAPEKIAEAHGRFSAAAVRGVIIQHQIIPRLQKDIAALTARNKELEAQVGKIKAASSLSKSHSAAVTQPGGAAAKTLPTDNMDAAKQIAAGMGIDTNS